MKQTRSPIRFLLALTSGLVLLSAAALAADWPEPKAPVVPQADGYVEIPGAKVPPDRAHLYRAIFDATRGADAPSQLIPAINMLGSELNAFAVAGVDPQKVKFAIVFHGAAIDGILRDEAYRSRFGTANPNLAAIKALKKQGVEMFVCGQNLAFAKIDPASLVPEVSIASDALIVLMSFQNRGYALLSF